MRVEVEYRSASAERYRDFRREHPNIKITAKQYYDVIRTYNSLFREYILETGERAKLPWGIGFFSINKKKMRRHRDWNGERKITLPIDWQKTKAAGKRIYNMNYHTDGHKFRWIWFTSTAYFRFSSLWNFKPSRESSRAIATYINKPEGKYADVYHEWKH